LQSGVQIGDLTVDARYFLAPLAGYTNLAFRLAIRELGGLGLATTDLVNARALLRGGRKTEELIRTCALDRPLAVQIYGSEPSEMLAAAQWLEAYGVSAVDINMGCPVHKVTRGGGGSALFCDPKAAIRLVHVVAGGVKIPVTVKMRLGWDDQSLSAPFFAREFEQSGVAAVTVHGRTRAQGFAGTVNLAAIRAVVEAVEKIPIIGNGDVRTVADARAMRQQTGCAAVAIGRGALLNPWIFNRLESHETTGDPGVSPSRQDHVNFMRRHFSLLVADRGEHFGCLQFRKVANWYCKVLHPGKDIQQRLVRLSSVREFGEIAQEVMERINLQEYPGSLPQADAIPVPSGPISHW
jgi:nifR3 family TIM-barrel protein